jgi:hypothetical protein
LLAGGDQDTSACLVAGAADAPTGALGAEIVVEGVNDTSTQ